MYYVHVFGDHIEANSSGLLAYVDALTNKKDRDNPGIIPDLLDCCDDLFESQLNTYSYLFFKQELETLKEMSEELTDSIGGVDTEEEFSAYHKCAEDLLELLHDYIPGFLENEKFFSDAFDKW